MSVRKRLSKCIKDRLNWKQPITKEELRYILGEDYEDAVVEGRYQNRIYFEENNRFFYIHIKETPDKYYSYVLQGRYDQHLDKVVFVREVSDEELIEFKKESERLKKEAKVYDRILNHRSYRLKLLFEN